jgi:hypothetical protein
MNTPKVKLAFPECVRVESKPHLFCPGCGHPEVLKALGFAVDALGIQRRTAFGSIVGMLKRGHSYSRYFHIQLSAAISTSSATCLWRIDTVAVKRSDPRNAQQPRT